MGISLVNLEFPVPWPWERTIEYRAAIVVACASCILTIRALDHCKQEAESGERERL